MRRNLRAVQRPTENQIQDNTLLIDWVSAIYGIFWGVWLGFFATKLTTSCSGDPLIKLVNMPINVSAKVIPVFYSIGLTAFGISILAYTFFLVKWLWIMRTIKAGSTYRTVFSKLGQAVTFWIWSILVVAILSWFCNTGSEWFWMGAWSTLGWLGVVSAVVLVDRGGWE